MGCLSSTSVTEIVNDGEEGDVQNQSICIVESELGGLGAGWLWSVERSSKGPRWMLECVCSIQFGSSGVAGV